MSFLTPFLSFLIIVSTSLSVIFIQSIYVITGKQKEIDSIAISKRIILYNFIIFIAIATLGDIQIYNKIPIKFNLLLFLSIPLALMTFFMEILPSVLKSKIKGETIEIEVTKAWRGKRITLIALTVIIAFQEELIFRGLWFEILLNTWKVPIIITLLISSIFFAINHIAFGIEIFMEKIIAAIVFGFIYIISGNLLLVMLTHALENIFILWKFKKT